MDETTAALNMLKQDAVKAFCRRHGIIRLGLFGSVLRGDFAPESDVDFLVEFGPGRSPSFFRLFDMEAELSKLLDGHRADMRTLEDLSPYFRDDVAKEARMLYDAA